MIKKDNNSEIRISGSKVKDIFILKWKICLVTVSIALVIAIVSTIMTFLSSDGGTKGSYYQATTKVYVNWDEQVNDAFRILDDGATQAQAWQAYVESYQNYISIYLQEWQKAKVNAAITDSNNYLHSNTIRNQLNSSLVANGYDEINGCDVLSVSSTGTSHLFTLTVSGYENSDRVEFLASEAARLYIEQGQEKLNLVDCEIVDEPEVYKVTRSTSKTGTVSFTRNEYYPDKDVAKTVEQDQSNTTLSVILSKKNILIVGLGFIVGIGIILIHILKDKKIREIIEVEALSDIQYLGTITDESEDQSNTVGVTIASLCLKDQISNISLISLQDRKAKGYKMLEDIVTENKIAARYVGSMNNASVVRKASTDAGIILIIQAGKDDEKSFMNTLNTIEVIRANLLGYVLYK